MNFDMLRGAHTFNPYLLPEVREMSHFSRWKTVSKFLKITGLDQNVRNGL